MVESGAPLQSNHRVLSRKGRVIWFQCEAKLVRDEDGLPWFIHGIAIDITELKETYIDLQKSNELVERRAQELESANLRHAANLEKVLEVKAAFLSVISHELRTPSNVING